MVADYRATGSMRFYWLADDPVDLDTPTLPYTVERDFTAGWAFQAAGHFYESLRPHLADPLLASTDAFLRMIYPDACGADNIVDLFDDAGGASGDDDGLYYAMRPDTVTKAVARAAAVEWPSIEATARGVADQLVTDPRYMPDVDWFQYVVDHHVRWLREAAETDRGLVVLISS